MAVYALGKIGAPSVHDRVLEMAEADRSTKVRRVAETALAWINGEEDCHMDLRDFFGNIELQ
jgi:HEAT repeat protein